MAALGSGSAARGEPAPDAERAAAVVLVGRPSPAADQVLALALEGATAQRGLLLLGPAELRGRLDAARPVSHAEADDLRLRARRDFLEFRFAEAAEGLARARELLLARLGDLLGDPELASASLDLARVLLELGDRDRALDVLVELARTAPEAAPGAEDYPPVLLEAWRSALEAAAERPPPSARALAERAAPFVRRAGVRWLAVGVVRDAGDDGIGLELAVVDGTSGALVRESTAALEAGDSWAEPLGEALFGPQPAPAVADERSDRAELYVLSRPPGAAVSLDGLATDLTTPALLDVDPGFREVTLSLEGFLPAELVVRAWPGQTTPVELVLPARGRPTVARSWWLWTLVGAVLAGAATGISLWVLSTADERPDVTVTVSQGALAPRFPW